MVSAEVVATSLEVPEGPVVIGPGAIAFVEQARGRVSLFDNGKLSTIAEGPGSPNALALGDDGFLYAAQNGGVVGAWRSPRPCRPAVERVGFDGTVAAVVHEVAGIPLGAPNDLVFGPDGRLYLTDPGEAYEPSRPIATSRLFAIGPGEGEGEVLEEPGPVYAERYRLPPRGDLLLGRVLCSTGLHAQGRRAQSALPVPRGSCARRARRHNRHLPWRERRVTRRRAPRSPPPRRRRPSHELLLRGLSVVGNRLWHRL